MKNLEHPIETYSRRSQSTPAQTEEEIDQLMKNLSLIATQLKIIERKVVWDE